MMSLLQTLLRRGESLSVPIKANSLGEKADTHISSTEKNIALIIFFPLFS